MTDSNASPSSTTHLILTASAFALGVLGVLLLFAPVEVSAAFGWNGGKAAPSLAAAGLLAVAILDWTGRGAVYGGIYGRPIVLANLVLALTGGLALLRVQFDAPAAHPLGWIPAATLVVHGVAFGLLLTGRVGGPPRK